MENIFQNKMSKKNEELAELRHKLDIPVTNDIVNMLQETLQKLRGELQEKNLQINNLQKINNDLQGMVSNRQGTYLRSSNLRDRL
jgi:predicted nuclease with TOPRIM domain